MSEAFRLDGKVVVLTGGAGLLGTHYVPALVAVGARVVVADLAVDPEQAARLEAEGPVAVVETDVTDPGAVEALRVRVLERFGRVDALVNNAAVDPKFDAASAAEHGLGFETYPLEAWERSLAVNLTGAFLCARSLAPAILESGGGSIVNVSSMYGVVGPDQRLYDDGTGGPPRYKPPDYTVTKAGLLGLTRYLATYYAGRPLRVNALVLGGVEAGHDEGFLRRYAERVPMGRMARPDEYGDALVFLLSDAASYMTGATLVLDGGWTAW